jgi:hypothetical protein
MKKNGIIVILMFLFIGTSIAQTQVKAKRTNVEKAKKQTEILTQQLNLSAEQQTKLQEMILYKLNQIDNVKQKYPENQKKDRNAELREIRSSFAANMKSLLNAEQFEKWNKAREDRIAKAKENKGKVKKSKAVENEGDAEDIF